MAEWHNYYNLLELTQEATLEDIRNRYRYLKNLVRGGFHRKSGRLVMNFPRSSGQIISGGLMKPLKH